MTYGLRITNAGGRTVIDSDESYRAVKVQSTGTGSIGGALPSYSQLLFARPSGGSGYIGKYGSNWGDSYFLSSAPSYVAMDLMDTGFPTPGTYGMWVREAGGNVIWRSDQVDQGLDIVAQGTLHANTNLVVTVGGTFNMSQVYCLMNNTQLYRSAGSTQIVAGYKYESGRNIRVQNYVTGDGIFSANTDSPVPFTSFTWVILRRRT